jgi:hypothetical protein
MNEHGKRTSRILPFRTKVAALSFSQRSIVVVLLNNALRWYKLLPRLYIRPDKHRVNHVREKAD